MYFLDQLGLKRNVFISGIDSKLHFNAFVFPEVKSYHDYPSRTKMFHSALWRHLNHFDCLLFDEEDVKFEEIENLDLFDWKKFCFELQKFCFRLEKKLTHLESW